LIRALAVLAARVRSPRKKKDSPGGAGAQSPRGSDDIAGNGGLVFAAGLQGGKDHQIGIGKKPLFVVARDFRALHRKAQAPAARHIAEVFQTDARQPNDFVFSENLLTGPDGDIAHVRRLNSRLNSCYATEGSTSNSPSVPRDHYFLTMENA
jgi:hypothetical protein